MSIEKIAEYPLPREDEIPAPRVPWRLDASRAALLVHDMQRYFVERFAPHGAPIAQVTDNIANLLRRCRERGVPVFYTAQHGNQPRYDRGLQADFWGPGMRAVPEHEAIVDALVPVATDLRLVKHRYSAFQRSHFAELLRARGRDQLVICGVYAHIGCLLTAADAFQHDIQPFLAADAVAAYSREKHDFAMQHVAHCCGVSMSTEKILAALAAEGEMPTDVAVASAATRGEPAVSPLTLERMRADIAAILHETPEEIGLDDNLLDLGLDSMRVMTLRTQWNDSAGIELEFADIAEHLTLAGWWRVVQARVAAAK